MENKSDLIDLAWMVYYLTWDWCQQSEDNMAQAVELYVESCEDEGVVSNESICQRALDIFACPSPSEAVSVMTTEEEDRLSLADRPLLAAENDLLETMDFFISIGSYTEEDRTAILDKELVNSSVAERCAETLKTLGLSGIISCTSAQPGAALSFRLGTQCSSLPAKRRGNLL